MSVSSKKEVTASQLPIRQAITSNILRGLAVKDSTFFHALKIIFQSVFCICQWLSDVLAPAQFGEVLTLLDFFSAEVFYCDLIHPDRLT